MSVLRRMMMDGFNIDAISSSRKIYYTASEKITPKGNTLGSKVQVNIYNATTMNGTIVTESDITSIGGDAFRDCTSLNSIAIPDSVTSIGNRTFEGCNSLTNITIPNSVTEIGNRTFEGCNSLTNITIPNSVTEIGYAVFSGCSSLTEFNSEFASEDGRCLIIDGVLTSFAPYGLTEYAIPDSVMKIGNGAFENCKSLTSVNIPNSLTTIGNGAFSGCSSLTSVTIPNSVTTIGETAFYECYKLTSVTIPESVKTIGGAAFTYCRRLTGVYCKATTPPILKSFSGCFDENGKNRKIYVPMESVDAYKSAEGWRVYASAIEGYEF